MSRSKITLREANAAYRELCRNAKVLMHRAETFLITAIVLYKILTNLFFLPAMRGIWSLTLRFSPVNYLTNNNAHQIFTAPSILGGIAFIAVLAALWNLYEFSLVLHGLDFARRTRRRRGMAGALRLLQSHGRRKAGPSARRPVEIAERRRIVCALERPQPGLRRRSDTAAIQCNDFRPDIIKKRPAALRDEPPNHVLI